MKTKILINAISVAAVCLATLLPCEARKKQHKEHERTGIVAHRGFWNCEEAGYAKNSVAALECAQKNHFWGSEFDVNMTADSVLMVFHDSFIDGKRIEDYPYSEFADFRLANGECIPTIDMYLEQGRKSTRTMLVYELKPHSSPEIEDVFVELTISKLKEYRLLKPRRVMFISFSYHICQKLAELLPGFTVQYLNGEKAPAEVMSDGINGIDYHYSVFHAHPDWRGQAEELGMSTNAWTVNSEKEMKSMIDMQVMYITTDNPLQLREVLRRSDRKEAR